MSSLLQWDFTLDDTSPVFVYKPYGDVLNGSDPNATLPKGWQTWYTGSGFLSSTGASPSGNSYHLTSLSGASVSLSFYGTGISLSGLTNCSYEVTLDGTIITNATLTDNILYQASNLTAGTHNVSITAQPTNSSQVLSFDGATVTSVANSTVQSPIDLSIDNQNTSVITYTGNWTPNKVVSGIPSASTSLPFHSTTDLGASALLNFSGRAVALYGSATSSHGQYSITLDGQQYILNGTSEWLLGNMLMFYQDGLNESVPHFMNITNFGFEEALSITSIDVKQFRTDEPSTSNTSTSASATPTVSAASSTSTHHTNVGAIVGPIIGVLAVLVAAALFFVCRRRRRSSSLTVEPFKSTGGLTEPSSAGTAAPAYAEHFRGYREAPMSDSITHAPPAPTDAYNPYVPHGPAAAMLSEKARMYSGSNVALDSLSYDSTDGGRRPTLDAAADERRSMASVPVTAAPFSALSQSEVDMISPLRAQPQPLRRGVSRRPLPMPESTAQSMMLSPAGAGYAGTPTAQSGGTATAQLEGDIVDRIVERVAARIAPGGQGTRFSSSDDESHLPPYTVSS